MTDVGQTSPRNKGLLLSAGREEVCLFRFIPIIESRGIGVYELVRSLLGPVTLSSGA